MGIGGHSLTGRVSVSAAVLGQGWTPLPGRDRTKREPRDVCVLGFGGETSESLGYGPKTVRGSLAALGRKEAQEEVELTPSHAALLGRGWWLRMEGRGWANKQQRAL